MICFVTSSLPCHSSAALSGNLVANLFFSIGTHLFWNLHFHYLTLFFGNFITFMVMDNFTDLMWNLITNSLRNLKLWYNCTTQGHCRRITEWVTDINRPTDHMYVQLCTNCTHTHCPISLYTYHKIIHLFLKLFLLFPMTSIMIFWIVHCERKRFLNNLYSVTTQIRCSVYS